jgi:hypothetical protein
MDDRQLRVEQLLHVSGSARRLADFVAAAQQPLRYEVLRHLLRFPEDIMIATLNEAVAARFVARGPDPHTYVPDDEAKAEAIRRGMDNERLTQLRAQIQAATRRVVDSD